MPYSIKKLANNCYTVINILTGKIHAKCSTKKNAEKQLSLLKRIEFV